MAHSRMVVDDPDLVEAKNVDKQGRVYVGKEFAGERVRLVIKRIEDS